MSLLEGPPEVLRGKEGRGSKKVAGGACTKTRVIWEGYTHICKGHTVYDSTYRTFLT